MTTRSLGDLFVSLSLRSTDFSKGVAEAADKVEGLASKAAAAIGDISGGFAVLGGVAAGALALASTGAEKLTGVSTRAKTETERLQRATTLLAVEVSEVLLPAMRAMTDGVLRLVGMWRSLDEGTRKNIGSMLGWSAAIGGALAATSKGLVIFKGFFELAVVLAPALGALVVPLLAVAAAMAGLLLLAGAIKSATGLTFAQVGEAIGAAAEKIRQAISFVWDGVQTVLEAIERGFEVAFRGVVSTVRSAVKVILDAVLAVAGKIGSIMAPLARGAGANRIASAWESAQVATSDGIMEAFDKGAAALEEGAKRAAKALPGALAQAALGPMGAVVDVKMIGKDLKSALTGAKEILGDAYKALGIEDVLSRLEGFGKGQTPGVPAAFAAVDVGRAGGGALSDSMMARLGGNDPVTAARRKMLDDKAREIEEAAKSLAESVSRAAASAKDQLVNRALGKLGDLGGIISNAMGAAAGGPLAVVGSVMVDVLSQSEGFKSLMQTVSGIIKVVADAFSGVFTALEPLVGALGIIIQAVMSALQPVLDVVASVLQSLAPPLMVVGMLLQALAPVIDILIRVLMLVTQPLMLLAGPIMKALFDVLKLVSIIILTVVKSIGSVWNAILDAVIWVLKAIDKLPMVDMGKAIKAVQGAKMDTDALGEQIQEMKDMSWDDAMNGAANAADNFKNATNDAAKEMLNVPAIWKRALRTGQVQDGQLPPGMGGGAAPGGGAPAVGNTTTINIIGYDIDEATDHAMRLQEQEELRMRGRDGNNNFASPRLVTP
jgi:hypothetical protein